MLGKAAILGKAADPPSTRRIWDVGFGSQLLLLGHPESARVGEAAVNACDAEDGVSVVVPQIAALSIVPTAAFPKPLSLSAQTMRDRFQVATPYSSVTQSPPALESEMEMLPAAVWSVVDAMSKCVKYDAMSS